MSSKGGHQKTIHVTVVNLDSGASRQFPSVTKAAACMGVCLKKVCEMVRARQSYLQWYVHRSDEDHSAAIVTQREIYRRNRKPLHRRNAQQLVSLRIDRHTVILVTPDKANEAYAEQWRQRREADRRHNYRHDD